MTDPVRGADPCAMAARLPRGWGIIYRHFGVSERDEIAARLAQIAHTRRLILLIAADPVLARKVGAAGVHWPEARISEARKWRGAFGVMTASAHSRASAYRLLAYGIDAAVRSSVFKSGSPSAGPEMGAPAFRREAATATLPYYALGGVDADCAGAIAYHAGFAAISGIEAAFGA